MFSMTPYTSKLTRRNYINPFADDFFRTFFSDNSTENSFRVDVQDKGDNYLVEAEMPGVKKEDVRVSINDGVMTISATMNANSEETKNEYVYRERRYGSMSRSFSLEGIDEMNIAAEYKDGILTLTLPKVKEVEKTAREISIN